MFKIVELGSGNRLSNYNTIDIVKLIMAVFVVALHTNLIGTCDNIVIERVFFSVVRLAVPFFFIASGFFSGGLDDLKKLKKYIKKTVKLYFVWSIVYLPLALYEYIKDNIGVVKGIYLYLLGFFVKGEHYDSWQLWYLLSLIYALLFIKIILRKFKNRGILLISFLITLIGFILNYYSNKELQLPFFLNIILLFGRTMTGCFPVAVGICIRDIKIKINSYIVIVLFLMYFCIKGVGFFVPFVLMPDQFDLFNFIYGIILFILVKSFDENNNNLCPFAIYARKLSTIIYFVHMYFLFVFCNILFKEKEYIGIQLFCFCLIGSILLGLMWIVLHRKLTKGDGRM